MRLGGRLASVTQEADTEFLLSILSDEKYADVDYFWLGGLGRLDKNGSAEWKWLSGEPWEYTNRLSSDHGSSGFEDYLYMYHTGPDKGKWGYQRADEEDFPDNLMTAGFILEKELGSVGSIDVVLPEPPNKGIYQNMTLELFNVEPEEPPPSPQAKI